LSTSFADEKPYYVSFNAVDANILGWYRVSIFDGRFTYDA